jgi:hypothetical protein
VAWAPLRGIRPIRHLRAVPSPNGLVRHPGRRYSLPSCIRPLPYLSSSPSLARSLRQLRPISPRAPLGFCVPVLLRGEGVSRSPSGPRGERALAPLLKEGALMENMARKKEQVASERSVAAGQSGMRREGTSREGSRAARRAPNFSQPTLTATPADSSFILLAPPPKIKHLPRFPAGACPACLRHVDDLRKFGAGQDALTVRNMPRTIPTRGKPPPGSNSNAARAGHLLAHLDTDPRDFLPA